jgi:hypothetical protein
MKKLFVFFALVFAMVGLVGCSNVSQSYADKVNEAASNKEHYTYEEVMKALGDEAQDWTVTVLGSTNGAVYAVKGVTTKEEFQEIIDSEEDVECLIVTILNGKATAAKYSTTKDVEKK